MKARTTVYDFAGSELRSGTRVELVNKAGRRWRIHTYTMISNMEYLGYAEGRRGKHPWSWQKMRRLVPGDRLCAFPPGLTYTQVHLAQYLTLMYNERQILRRGR